MQVSMADMLGDEAIMTVEYAPQGRARGRPVLTTRVHSAMTTIGAKYKRAVGGTQGRLARCSGGLTRASLASPMHALAIRRDAEKVTHEPNPHPFARFESARGIETK